MIDGVKIENKTDPFFGTQDLSSFTETCSFQNKKMNFFSEL